MLAAGGFAALVAASEVAYLVLRVVGAAVLVLLGVRAGWAVWRTRGEGAAAHPDLPPAGGRRGSRAATVSGTVLVRLGVRLAVAGR